MFRFTTSGDTYVEIISSVLHDELGGVGFVFAVVDVHLELVGLEGEEQVEMRLCMATYFVSRVNAKCG